MRLIVLALLALALPAHAYEKPRGAPTLSVPEHGVTISVFAVQTAVGHTIGVFELGNDGDWKLCRDCYTSPEFPTMDPQVQSAGGGAGYVQSKIGEINAILARRYPAVMPPPGNSGVDQVNYALTTGFVLRFVGGVPVVAVK